MLYNRFIRVIEDHAESLTRSWIREIKSNPSTGNYAKLSDEELHNNVYDIYRKLGYWIKKEESSLREIAEHFAVLGRQRAKEGFKLSEVLYGIILGRVELWRYIMNEGLVNDPIDLNRALEFWNRISYFFDKAVYFTTVGFENTDLSEEELAKKGGFFDTVFESFNIWLIKEVNDQKNKGF
jgi:hypothetical protein